MKNTYKVMLVLSFVLALMFLVSISTYAASGQSMPWDAPLVKIQNSLTGPVAKAVSIIAIVISGLMLAMGESGTMFQKFTQIAFGCSIAFGASTLVANLFNTSTGSLVLILQKIVCC